MENDAHTAETLVRKAGKAFAAEEREHSFGDRTKRLLASSAMLPQLRCAGRVGQEALAMIIIANSVSEEPSRKAAERQAQRGRQGEQCYLESAALMCQMINDPQSEMRYWKEAMAAGSTNAGCNIGSRLLQKGDAAGALKAYEHSARRGYPLGMHKLGYLYDEGEQYGIRRDVVAARKWYQKAAALEYPDSICNLAMLLHEEEQITDSEYEDMLQKAIDLGCFTARTNLAQHLLMEQPVRAEALLWDAIVSSPFNPGMRAQMQGYSSSKPVGAWTLLGMLYVPTTEGDKPLANAFKSARCFARALVSREEIMEHAELLRWMLRVHNLRSCCECGLQPAAGKLKLCAQCAVVGYCSSECQAQSWTAGHRDLCAVNWPVSSLSAAMARCETQVEALSSLAYEVLSNSLNSGSSAPSSGRVEGVIGPIEYLNCTNPEDHASISCSGQADYVLVGEGNFDYGVVFANPMGKMIFKMSQNKANAGGPDVCHAVHMMFRMLQGFSKHSGVSEMEIKHQLATEYGIEPDEIKHSNHSTRIDASDLNAAGLVAAESSGLPPQTLDDAISQVESLSPHFTHRQLFEAVTSQWEGLYDGATQQDVKKISKSLRKSKHKKQIKK